MHMQFLSGPAVSVQGAWFATPYWGFGGRMSCTNLRVKVNGVAQNDNLECASMYAGPYFSHPFSMRWLVGAKLLGGCEIYKPCRTDFRRLERRAGFSFGTGLSTTYLATQNLGVRFSTDYDVAPPVVRSSRERLHKLTFSMEVCPERKRKGRTRRSALCVFFPGPYRNDSPCAALRSRPAVTPSFTAAGIATPE